MVKDVLDLQDFLIIPESPWGNQYTIDHVWCLVSKLNMRIFRNIIRVREYPELCENLAEDSEMFPLTIFKKYRNDSAVRMNPAFCSQNRTWNTSTFQIPWSILLAMEMYNI